MGDNIKMIRFIDSNYNELFKIADGKKIKITYPEGTYSIATCEYIDEYHVCIAGNCYHICQWAEFMKKSGSKYEPYGDESVERTIFAEITVNDLLTIESDMGTCDYLEKEWEASGIEQSGVYLDRVLMPESDSTDEWECYINYLINWAFDHSDESNRGMSPVCFDEWKGCEDSI